MEKTRKFKGFKISDREPKVGDVLICVWNKSMNYGLLSNPCTQSQITSCSIDVKNWKVVEAESLEDRK